MTEVLGMMNALPLDVLANAQLSMWELLLRTAETFPDNPAVVDGEEILTYEELVDRSLRCATRLAALGVERGARVAIQFQSCADWVMLHYGLCRLGAVVVPVSLVFEGRELAHVLSTSAPQHMITVDRYRGVDHLARWTAVAPDFADAATEVASVPSLRSCTVIPVDERGSIDRSTASYRRIFGDADTRPLCGPEPAAALDAAYVIYTSGSTAFPKPALLKHRAFAASATGYAASMRLTPDDRLLVMLPTFHITGPCLLLVAHATGAAVHLIGHFDAERALAEIERGRCTSTIGFPTNMTKLLAAPSFPTRDLSSFTKVVIGGTPAYLEHVYRSFNLDIIGTIYGSTESAGLVSASEPDEDDLQARITSNGRPLPGVEIRIIDPDTGRDCARGEPGEICFRGVVRFDGYLPGTPDVEGAIDDVGYGPEHG